MDYFELIIGDFGTKNTNVYNLLYTFLIYDKNYEIIMKLVILYYIIYGKRQSCRKCFFYLLLGVI
jgi:hypothetical protein